jgi:hypothetical protein
MAPIIYGYENDEKFTPSTHIALFFEIIFLSVRIKFETSFSNFFTVKNNIYTRKYLKIGFKFYLHDKNVF